MIERGGKDEERLYLKDYELKDDLGEKIVVKKTDMPDMGGVIARHKARYYLPAFYVRPDKTVLDFPCGSGYGCQILNKYGGYEGMDIDAPTIEYCKKSYGKMFKVGDLTKPELENDKYDVITCIEGLEHIESRYQMSLIKAFYHSLRVNGILIVSSPSAGSRSRINNSNKYHKWELSQFDFTNILKKVFTSVQIIIHQDINHQGNPMTMMFGICKKEGRK